MRYQIQKYNLTDHAEREVLGQSVDMVDQSEIQQWVTANTPSLVESGFGIATVEETHDWYIAPVECKLTSMEGPVASFEEVAKYELARSREERLALSAQLLAEGSK